MRKFLIPIMILLLMTGCGKKESADLEITDATEEATPKHSQSILRDSVLQPSEDAESEEAAPTETHQQDTEPTQGAVQTTVPTQPSKPTPTTPKPTDPAPAETTPPEAPKEETVPPATDPKPTQPTIPEPTESAPTKPPPTEPAPTEPEITEPTPTEPETTEPTPTEPIPEVIDTAALEAYGRSYASSAYGYNGTSSCGPGSGAGYFPGATKEILTMADGYSLVCQAIDSQYARDIASGYAPYEEIDGVTVRCPINVRVESTGQANMYVIWVYYGGA